MRSLLDCVGDAPLRGDVVVAPLDQLGGNVAHVIFAGDDQLLRKVVGDLREFFVGAVVFVGNEAALEEDLVDVLLVVLAAVLAVEVLVALGHQLAHLAVVDPGRQAVLEVEHDLVQRVGHAFLEVGFDPEQDFQDGRLLFFEFVRLFLVGLPDQVGVDDVTLVEYAAFLFFFKTYLVLTLRYFFLLFDEFFNDEALRLSGSVVVLEFQEVC